MAWLRGDFDAARSHFERRRQTWPQQTTTDRRGVVHTRRADRDGAPAFGLGPPRARRSGRRRGRVAQAARRADELGFPQGPYMHGYARFMETWIASKPVSSTVPRSWSPTCSSAERHGLDMWRLIGATLSAYRRPRGTRRRRPRPDRARRLTSRR